MAITLARGSDQYLSVPYNAVLAPAGAISLMAWVKPSSVTMQRVVSRYMSQSTANEIWGLDVYQNNCRMILGKGTGGLFGTTYSVDTVAGGSVPAGVWSHIAATWNGSTAIVYVNGAQVGSIARTAALVVSSTPMSIGADWQGSTTNLSEYFDGSLADLRIYKRAVTANEVQSLYTTAGSSANLTGLVAHFHFRGPSGTSIPAGTTFKDQGPTGLIATLNGGGIYDNEISRIRRSL